MRRTRTGAVTAMRRTKVSYPDFYQHWGGHLPFPPVDCPNFSLSFVDEKSGLRWIDIGVCWKKTCGRYPCVRLQEYKAREYQQELTRLSAILRAARPADNDDYEL